MWPLQPFHFSSTLKRSQRRHISQAQTILGLTKRLRDPTHPRPSAAAAVMSATVRSRRRCGWPPPTSRWRSSTFPQRAPTRLPAKSCDGSETPLQPRPVIVSGLQYIWIENQRPILDSLMIMIHCFRSKRRVRTYHLRKFLKRRDTSTINQAIIHVHSFNQSLIQDWSLRKENL